MPGVNFNHSLAVNPSDCGIRHPEIYCISFLTHVNVFIVKHEWKVRGLIAHTVLQDDLMRREGHHFRIDDPPAQHTLSWQGATQHFPQTSDLYVIIAGLIRSYWSIVWQCPYLTRFFCLTPNYKIQKQLLCHSEVTQIWSNILNSN